MRSPTVRRATQAVVVAAVVMALVLLAAGPAQAEPAPAPNPTGELSKVLDRATAWLFGIGFGICLLIFTYGAVRYVLAGGDPGEVERAKSTMSGALKGLGLVVLAPILVQIVRGILGV